ncbi:caffeyl-CoA reductase-Etf complex subunit CarE [Lachnospiraceae bacterium]|nr:caffeyl-CoA reductase-Etf complex subunit CarE [Lachnospiraceae bacterium]
MIGIYFSGTGNTKFCVDKFLKEYNHINNSFSIEDKETLGKIKNDNEIVIGYPVQYSNIPKILRDYIVHNWHIWKGKNIFIIATMGLFSGDGAGILARLLKKYDAIIMGGLHLKMPDSICDEKVLKRSFEENKKIVMKAEEKICKSVYNIKNGKPPQEGLGIVHHLAGLFGQRLYFFRKTQKYTDKLKINSLNCIGCGLCEKLCPMGNIVVKNGIAVSDNKCTMCYRCISKCPKQAITLLGKKVIEQNDISSYL